MKINLALSSLANVLGLINEKNGSNITESQVIVNEVIESDENPGDDTKITLTGIDGQGIEGTRSFYYGRGKVSEQVFPLPASVELAPGDGGAEAVAKFLVALNLRLEDINYTNWVFPTVETPGGVSIQGATGSLIYHPEWYRLTLTRAA